MVLCCLSSSPLMFNISMFSSSRRAPCGQTGWISLNPLKMLYVLWRERKVDDQTSMTSPTVVL